MRNMKLDPDMTIKEWVEADIDRGAWDVLEFALHNIENGTYHRNGVPCLHQATLDFTRDHNLPHPQWVQDIRAILERQKKDDYEWSDNSTGPTGPTGPKGPYG